MNDKTYYWFPNNYNMITDDFSVFLNAFWLGLKDKLVDLNTNLHYCKLSDEDLKKANLVDNSSNYQGMPVYKCFSGIEKSAGVQVERFSDYLQGYFNVCKDTFKSVEDFNNFVNPVLSILMTYTMHLNELYGDKVQVLYQLNWGMKKVLDCNYSFKKPNISSDILVEIAKLASVNMFSPKHIGEFKELSLGDMVKLVQLIKDKSPNTSFKGYLHQYAGNIIRVFQHIRKEDTQDTIEWYEAFVHTLKSELDSLVSSCNSSFFDYLCNELQTQDGSVISSLCDYGDFPEGQNHYRLWFAKDKESIYFASKDCLVDGFRAYYTDYGIPTEMAYFESGSGIDGIKYYDKGVYTTDRLVKAKKVFTGRGLFDTLSREMYAYDLPGLLEYLKELMMGDTNRSQNKDRHFVATKDFIEYISKYLIGTPNGVALLGVMCRDLSGKVSFNSEFTDGLGIFMKSNTFCINNGDLNVIQRVLMKKLNIQISPEDFNESCVFKGNQCILTLIDDEKFVSQFKGVLSALASSNKFSSEGLNKLFSNCKGEKKAKGCRYILYSTDK